MNRKSFWQFNYTTSRFPWPAPFDGDEGGEGDKGDSSGGEPTITPEMQKLIESQVSAATEGLKNTNTQLKTEKTQIKEQLDQLLGSVGGKEGLEALKTMRQNLEKDELAKMIAEGRHEEYIEAKTKALRGAHRQELDAVAGERDEFKTAAEKAVQRLHNVLLTSEVVTAAATVKTQNEPGVLADITRAAREVFTWSDEYDSLVILDGEVVVNGKDGRTPKTVAEWLAEQQPTSRHWWGASSSGGANGSKKVLADGRTNPWSKDAWNLTEQGKLIRELGLAEAEKLAKAAGSRVGATAPFKAS